MNPQKKADDKRSWQAAVDQNLSRQLLRSKVQPGLINHDLAGRILARSQTMVSRSPDATVLNQYHEIGNDLSSSPLNPIFVQGNLPNTDRKRSSESAYRPYKSPDQAKSEAGPTLPRSPGVKPPQNQPLLTKPLSRTASSDTAFAAGQATVGLSKSEQIGAIKAFSAKSDDRMMGVIKRQTNNAGNLNIQRSSTSPKSARPKDIHPAKTAIEVQHRGTEGSAAKNGSSHPKNMTMMRKTGLPSDARINPVAGNPGLDIIQRKKNATLYQGGSPEKPAHRMSEQATSYIVNGNKALKSPTPSLSAESSVPVHAGRMELHSPADNTNSPGTADLQPAIRRRNVNRVSHRPLQRKVSSPEASLWQPQRPYDKIKNRGSTNPPDRGMSLAASIVKQTGAAVKARAASAATHSPGDSGTMIQPRRLRYQTQPLAGEQALMRQTTHYHLQTPKTSRSEVSTPFNLADLGIAIQKRYHHTFAGDAVQRKAAAFGGTFVEGNKPKAPTPLNVVDSVPNKAGVISRQVQNNPAIFAEHRNMPLAGSSESPGRSSEAVDLSGLHSRTGGIDRYNPTAALNSAARSMILVQTKSNEESGSAGSASTSQPQLELPTAPTARTGAEVDVVQLADQVYEIIFQRLSAERERKGF